MTNGSKSFSVTLSDGVATIRDAILLLLSSGIAYVGERFLEGGFPPELHGALVVILFAGIKFAWKYFTDTQRISMY